MLFSPKYWHTPQPDILPDTTGAGKESIYSPEYICQQLALCGLQCTTAGHDNAAQITTYHYNLTSPKDLIKANKAVKCLAAILHTPCKLTASDRASFAVQIAKSDRAPVTLRRAVSALKPDRTRTMAAIGTDQTGQPVTIDVAILPHLLIAGATGSGKSVALNTIICSMLFSACPGMTKFVMIDPKQVELSAYAKLPHLYSPIVTSAEAALKTLKDLNTLMDKRYKLMAHKHVKDIEQTDLPRIIVIIDELADLMIVSKKEVESYIIRIAQLGRAAGIHLIVATQKPVVSVVTGLIQGNIPCKLALQTASANDSVRILGHKGAETLLGKGDALLKLPDRVEEIRLQCAYTSPADVDAVVQYWKHDAKHR